MIRQEHMTGSVPFGDCFDMGDFRPRMHDSDIQCHSHCMTLVQALLLFCLHMLAGILSIVYAHP